jgi:hypothetical protein
MIRMNCLYTVLVSGVGILFNTTRVQYNMNWEMVDGH